MTTLEVFKTKLKKNDQVQVMSGREKGKTGKVLQVNFKTGRITVEKVNLVKKHAKPTQKNPQGGAIEKELPLHFSNVLLLCPKCNRGVRHGYKFVEAAAKKGSAKGVVQTKKVRVCKRCQENLDPV